MVVEWVTVAHVGHCTVNINDSNPWLAILFIGVGWPDIRCISLHRQQVVLDVRRLEHVKLSRDDAGANRCNTVVVALHSNPEVYVKYLDFNIGTKAVAELDQLVAELGHEVGVGPDHIETILDGNLDLTVAQLGHQLFIVTVHKALSNTDVVTRHNHRAGALGFFTRPRGLPTGCDTNGESD